MDSRLVNLSVGLENSVSGARWCARRTNDVVYCRKIKYGQADLTDNAYADSPSESGSKSSAAPQKLSDDVPGVSILRPLRGLDVNLHEGLASSFVQRYPKNKFEIICSVADEDDQAIEVFSRVKAQYPDVDARIVVGSYAVPSRPDARLICVLQARRLSGSTQKLTT